MVLIHHLFDAGWSAPIRRYLEHFSCLLFPWLGVAFIPIGFMAPDYIYPWMQVTDPHEDHALYVKKALLISLLGMLPQPYFSILGLADASVALLESSAR